MQGFFEQERLDIRAGSRVGHTEAKRQLASENELVSKLERAKANCTARLVGVERERQVQVFAGQRSKSDLPVRGARKAVGRRTGGRMHWRSGRRAKPRENDRDTAANRLARSKGGALGKEEHGLLASGLPVRQVGALQIELGGASGRGDRDASHARIRLVKREYAGETELFVAALKVHWLQCRASLGLAEYEPARAHHNTMRLATKEIDGMVKALLCDIDGTLVQSNWLHAEAWQKAFAEMGIALEVEDVRRQIGKGGDELIPVFVPWWKRKHVEEPLKTYRKFVFQHGYIQRVKPLPEVREFLQRVKAAGIRVALASSSDKDDLLTLKRTANIEDLIDEETSADDTDRAKPHPDIFSAVMKKLGLGPDECMALGDTPYDAESAGKAGVRTIGVMTGGWSREDLLAAGCVEVYESVADLLGHFDESALVRVGVLGERAQPADAK